MTSWRVSRADPLSPVKGRADRERTVDMGWRVGSTLAELAEALAEDEELPSPWARRVLFRDDVPWSVVMRHHSSWMYLEPSGGPAPVVIPARTELRDYTLIVDGIGTVTGKVPVSFGAVTVHGSAVSEVWRRMRDGSLVEIIGGVSADPACVPALEQAKGSVSDGFGGVLTPDEIARAVSLLSSPPPSRGWLPGSDPDVMPSRPLRVDDRPPRHMRLGARSPSPPPALDRSRRIPRQLAKEDGINTSMTYIEDVGVDDIGEENDMDMDDMDMDMGGGE